MMKVVIVLIIASVAISTYPLLANDTSIGIESPGLEVEGNEVIKMVSEDLYISLKEIRVRYIFRNTSKYDVSLKVSFPIPLLSPGGPYNCEERLKHIRGTDPFDFKTSIDGKNLHYSNPPTTRAYAGKEYNGEQESFSELIERHRDVTDLLNKAGIPLTLNREEVMHVYNLLPQVTKNEFIKAGLITEGEILEPGETNWEPIWGLLTIYSRQQKFPAGKDVIVEHSYKPAPTTRVLSLTDDDIRMYSVDDATQRAFLKKVAHNDNQSLKNPDQPLKPGEVFYDNHYITYILTSAKSWQGPIGTFRLTIDKGDVKNIVSLSMPGIQKTGPTTFSVEKKNFVPERDLDVMFIAPVQPDHFKDQ